MKSAQIELKFDFPGFQTMGMNVAMSEFEYHEYLKSFTVHLTMVLQPMGRYKT